MITPATWKLPEGHRSVSSWVTEGEARWDATQRIRSDESRRFLYYITGKRGAWEVVEYSAPLRTEGEG
jgi:hypothetical protein